MSYKIEKLGGVGNAANGLKSLNDMQANYFY